MTDYDYVIAVDMGTSTAAWAIREHGKEVATAISPITIEQIVQNVSQDNNQKIYKITHSTVTNQKTPSDIHFFLKDENEPISVDNSQLGNIIQNKFKGAEFKVHYHFAFYRMALYEHKLGTHDFRNKTFYPDYPKVSPRNSDKEFKLSEIYTIVVQHVQKSIMEYFTNENLQFDIERIVWAITVPGIAQQNQKCFMIQCFKAGMGQFNGKYIGDERIKCVIEPEGGFLFAFHTMKKSLQSKDTNIAIFDFGGGMYDLTVAECKEGQNPKIIISDFGEAVGGSDVDGIFMADIEAFINISKANISEKYKSIILFNILKEFQYQKHTCLSAGKIDEVFTVNIREALNYVNPFDVETAIAKCNEDPNNPDIELDGGDLIFTTDFANMRYLYPVKTKLVQKTHELMEAAKAKGCNIQKGLMLGGFSQCDSLLKDFQAEINLQVITFPDPSLAIVRGATFYDRYEVDKQIKKGVGLEIVKKVSDLINLTNEEQRLFNDQYFKGKYVDQRMGICAGCIQELFQTGTKITNNLEVQKEFKPATPQSTEIIIILHQFEEEKQVPKLFVYDQYIINQGLNPVNCNINFSMGCIIPVPMNVAFERRVLTLKFQYQKTGDVVMLYYKWMDDTDFKAIYANKQIEDNSRFKSSKISNVHTVFVIDRSGSMGCPMKLEGAQVHPKNKFNDSVGDIFCGGIYEYLASRKKEMGSLQQNDRYSIVLFDNQVDIKCKQQQLQPDEVFNYQEQARGGTNFCAALSGALQAVQGTPANLVPQMIFLTDGAGTQPDDALVNQIKGAFKEQTYFLNFGAGADVGELSKRFGKAPIDIKNSQNVQGVFARLSIPEMI